MSLTTAQLQTLKANIAANANTVLIGGVSTPINQVDLSNGDNAFAVAAWYNLAASPAYSVWRTDVSRIEIYNNHSAENTDWDWSKYKSQSITEQNSWVQMFMGDKADFSKPNLRAGISNIFASASTVNATHAFAIGKRGCTNIEKVFATATAGGVGTRGSTANPDTMTFEGSISVQDVQSAGNS